MPRVATKPVICSQFEEKLDSAACTGLLQRSATRPRPSEFVARSEDRCLGGLQDVELHCSGFNIKSREGTVRSDIPKKRLLLTSNLLICATDFTYSVLFMSCAGL